MKFFNIQMAAQISGLSTHTIRAWEKRYGALRPERTDSGRRQYSGEDIERLTLLSQLTNLGNSIGQIARLPDGELKDIYEKLTHSREAVMVAMSHNPKRAQINAQQTLQNLVLALAGHKLDIISHELGKAKVSLTPGKFALDILLPLLREVEARRKGGHFLPAQVQALHAVIKFHVGSMLYVHHEKAAKSSSKIALAAPEGETQLQDVMLGALLCSHHQMNFSYLGADLPSAALSEVAHALESNIVVLGVSHPEQLKTPLSSYVEDLLARCKEACEVWIVGAQDLSSQVSSRSKMVRVFANHEDMERHLESLE